MLQDLGIFGLPSCRLNVARVLIVTLPDGEAVTQMEAGAGTEVKLRRVTGLEAEGQGAWGGVEYRGRVNVIGGGGGGVHYGVWRRCGRASIVIGRRRG